VLPHALRSAVWTPTVSLDGLSCRWDLRRSPMRAHRRYGVLGRSKPEPRQSDRERKGLSTAAECDRPPLLDHHARLPGDVRRRPGRHPRVSASRRSRRLVSIGTRPGHYRVESVTKALLFLDGAAAVALFLAVAIFIPRIGWILVSLLSGLAAVYFAYLLYGGTIECAFS